MRKIDINNWARKELYHNFIQFEDPFFNICADVDISSLKSYCDTHQSSFFIVSYFVMLKTVNSIEEFKYRIRKDEVIVHDVIRGSCPIMKPDRTFSYGYFDYIEDLSAFTNMAKASIEKVKSGERLDPKFDEDDLIHSSVLPWISFTSIEHAKRLDKGDSIPKIVLGKIYQREGKTMMPIAVSGHHSLMDGLHAGEFYQLYEELCRELK